MNKLTTPLTALLIIVTIWPATPVMADAGKKAIASPLLSHADEVLGAIDPKQNSELGNHIGIVDDGNDALLLRAHLIRAARKSIDIQTFILQNDECGRFLMYELIQAAKRGVKVRLLADHFMSNRDPDWVAFLATAHPNFQLKYYRPPAGQINPGKIQILVAGILFFRGSNQRMHNKVFIVDDAIAVMGGRNIDNHYYNRSTTYNFIDRDAVITGPLLPKICESFEAFWKFRRSVDAEKLFDVALAIKRESFDRPSTPDEFDFSGLFQDIDKQAGDPALIQERFVAPLRVAQKASFLVDPPGKNKYMLIPWGGGKVTKRLREVTKKAKESMYIQSPYLILNYRGRRVYKKLRKKNPDMHIVVSTNSFAATDNILAYSANYKLRSVYIEKLGFEIFEFRPKPPELLTVLPNYPDLERRALAEDPDGRAPFLSIHAKSLVWDDRITYVGSYNIDPRSDNLNTEIGLLIEDPYFAAKVKESILKRTAPESSWVIAKREFPLSEVNNLIEGISGLTPVDIWPLRNTASFELIPGKEPVPTDDKDFYKNYKEAGSFPGAEKLSSKQIVTYLYKMVNTLAIPVL